MHKTNRIFIHIFVIPLILNGAVIKKHKLFLSVSTSNNLNLTQKMCVMLTGSGIRSFCFPTIKQLITYGLQDICGMLDQCLSAPQCQQGKAL